MKYKLIWMVLLITLLVLVSPGTIDGMNDFVLGLIALPFGVLSCVGLYFILKRIWEGNRSDAIEIMDPKESRGTGFQ